MQQRWIAYLPEYGLIDRPNKPHYHQKKPPGSSSERLSYGGNDVSGIHVGQWSAEGSNPDYTARRGACGSTPQSHYDRRGRKSFGAPSRPGHTRYVRCTLPTVQRTWGERSAPTLM